MFGLFERNKPSILRDPAGITDIQKAVQRGFHSADKQIRRELSAVSNRMGSAKPYRADEIIAGIPALAASAARDYFRCGGRTAGDDFDCQFAIMELQSGETSETLEKGHYVLSDREQTGDPAKLSSAAKVVFDFCCRAGFNPVVVRAAKGYVWQGHWWGCFKIKLRLNLPPALSFPADSAGNYL